MQLKEGVPINDDEGLEHEADVMGRKAVASTEKTGKNNANQNKLYRERNNSGQIIITNAIQMEKFKCKVCKKDVDTEDGKLKQARKCPKCFSKAKNTERSKGQGDEYDASGEAHRKTSTKGRTGRTANQGHR
jgi:predicted Zn-ribbon and HTH transcriptional regulator